MHEADVRAGLRHAVLASRADLLEDCGHIRALGEAISGSKVRRLGLADCGFGQAALTSFAQSVSWETAALTEIDVSVGAS